MKRDNIGNLTSSLVEQVSHRRPFVALACAAMSCFILPLILMFGTNHNPILFVIISVSAAIIITFTSAIHWALAMVNPSKHHAKQALLSVIPALVAGLILVMHSDYDYLAFAITLAAIWIIEQKYFLPMLPNWYVKLHSYLTVVFILSLMITWIYVIK